MMRIIMKLSSCGIDCDACEIGTEKGCRGCFAIKGQPFWANEETCELYACAAEKSIPHCGGCGLFPCAMLEEWAAGENGERIDNLRKLNEPEKQE
ncbi:MAG: DUF3795 domain-containing protein [Eubacteriales bacterium]|nr:DUF3795 domain-containing protein [Eubacteriales bacterium]